MPATTACDPGPRPAFIPLPACARVVFRYALFGQTIENVFYFQGTGDFTAPMLQALAGECHAQWVASLQALLPTAIELLDITATATHVQNAPQFIETVNLPGGSTSAPFPDPGATFALKFGTAKTGRSYRGRMYWPCLRNDVVSAGEVQGTYATGLKDGLIEFFTQVNFALGVEHVVASYQAKCLWRTEGVATVVTSYTYTDLHIDSQRRRLLGRGI